MTEGIFLWERDHIKPKYTDWGEFQPSNSSSSEIWDCVVKAGGCLLKWIDWSCDSDFLGKGSIHALCEKNKIGY